MFCAYAVKFYTLDDSLMFILTRVPPSAEPSPTNTPTSTANLQNTPNATTGTPYTAPYTNSAFTAAYSTTRPARRVRCTTRSVWPAGWAPPRGWSKKEWVALIARWVVVPMLWVAVWVAL